MWQWIILKIVFIYDKKWSIFFADTVYVIAFAWFAWPVLSNHSPHTTQQWLRSVSLVNTVNFEYYLHLQLHIKSMSCCCYIVLLCFIPLVFSVVSSNGCYCVYIVAFVFKRSSRSADWLQDSKQGSWAEHCRLSRQAHSQECDHI